jgi:hypothetical protein
MSSYVIKNADEEVLAVLSIDGLDSPELNKKLTTFASELMSIPESDVLGIVFSGNVGDKLYYNITYNFFEVSEETETISLTEYPTY